MGTKYVRVALNGFGRIGRMILRASLGKPKNVCGNTAVPKIVAINDPFLPPKHMVYLLQYDSTHGRCKSSIAMEEKTIKIDGNTINVFHEKEPHTIPWKDIDYVVECSGQNTTKDKASKFLCDGIKNVIISAPSADCPMFVVGVNHECYEPNMKVISNASCTTNCLAPLVDIVHKNFCIEFGLMTTIHAVTASQAVLDAPKKKFRLCRTAFQNIIPTSTGAAAAIGKIIPDLEGKLTGTSMRVPVCNGSLVDLTVLLSKPFTFDEVKTKIQEASNGYLNHIIGYSDGELVSSDIIGDPRSSIFDAKASIPLNDCFMKLMAWYDNEWGYSNRILDLITYIHGRNMAATCE